MQMIVHGGGGSGTPAQQQAPRNEPIQHRTGSNDTLESLAAQYAVSPEAIRQANPQLGSGDELPQGELVEIPVSPQSVNGEVDPGSANYADTDVKVSLKNDDGSITWQPDSTSVKLTDKQKLELGNSRPEGSPASTNGFSVSLSSESSVTLTESQSDTHTTFSVSTGTQVSLSGEASAGGARGAHVEGSVATGFTSTYKVKLPGEATVEQAASVNPFDPTTIPVGGSVTVDGSSFVDTSFEASFRYIGTQTKINDAAGVSYTVERVDENTVRVLAGPTETINAFNGVGLSVGDLSVMAGREDQLHGASMQTAEFDISTPEGQAAFEHFNATGQVASETPGVANAATIERIDYSSQTQLRAQLGPVGVALGGAQNTGSVVKTTYPDGSFTVGTDLQYSDSVPLHVNQSFDAQGNEVVSERTYQFTIDTDRPSYNWWQRNIEGHNEGSEESNMAYNLNVALTGDASGDGPVQGGDKVTLTFSEEQMGAFLEQTRDAAATNESGMDTLALLTGGEDGMPVNSNFDFAVALVRNLGSDSYSFTQRLATIAQQSDGDIRSGIDPIDVTMD